MPAINQLPPTERKEFARSVAKELYEALDGHSDDANGYGERAYRRLAESGLLHEENFYAERLNAAQLDVLRTFHGKYHEAWGYAMAYDKHIAPLERIAPGFVFSSELLRRAWCVKHFLKELTRDDCPLAAMLVFEAVDDRDRTDESNDENDDDESEEEGSEEAGEEEGSGSGEGEEEEEEEEAEESDESDESDSDSEEGGEEADNGEPPPKRVKPVRECERKPEPEPENPPRGLLDSDSDSD